MDASTDYDFRVQAAQDEDISELEAAEYIVFNLALDTYFRYIEEVTGEEPPEDDENTLDEAPEGDTTKLDSLASDGIRLLKRVDSRFQEDAVSMLDTNLPSETHKKMLQRAFRRPARSRDAISRRALLMRTVLSRGGHKTVKAVFHKTRPLRAVKDALADAMMEDAGPALQRFAAVPIRNPRIKAWIKAAASVTRERDQPNAAPLNPVEVASSVGADHAEALRKDTVDETGLQGAEEQAVAGDERENRISDIESEAAEAAAEVLADAGEPDEVLTRSEVIGIATAAAVAASTDPTDPTNIPEPLKRLDDEQRAAAMTDGKVLVAAGAGSGKSWTLVARVEHLIKDRGVNPARCLVTSFNKKAALELDYKIGNVIGGDMADAMSIGTLHGLFRQFIDKYGTQEERIAVGVDRKGPNGFVKGGDSVASAVNRVWRKCYATQKADGTWKDADAPRVKDGMRAKTQWAGNNVTPAQAIEKAATPEEAQLAQWYEWYMGFKGDLGKDWEPPCGRKLREWEGFLAKKRLGGRIRLGDFDDMLGIFKDILKRQPEVKATVQAAFDHILVDECQDLNETQNEIIMMMSEHITDGSDGKSLWMVGDDKQCVGVDTPVQVSATETVPAGELQAGATVLAYRNGKLRPQKVLHAKHSDWRTGYKVTTESGKTLTMSPNHKIWAQGPVLEERQVAVYLMYRQDKGFRVGITNKCHDEDYYNSFGGRAFMEKAERMWVLTVCQDREEALLKEASYSLEYGVPTAVFEGASRGINQDRLDALFETFGHNGRKLLAEKTLGFDLPHWVSQSYTKHGRLRRTVQMTAHGSKGSQVALEWSGDDLDGKLEGIQFSKQANGRRRLRKWFTNYREALEFAEQVAERTGAALSRRLSTPEGPVRLLTASGLFSGMQVVVRDDEDPEAVALETIVSVEPVSETAFVDLDVEDASNFVGGGILSHNSIYAFRGARPDLFTALDGKEGWKTRSIRTNYRCPPEIVEAANLLIANNEDQIPMEATPNPARIRGMASMRVEQMQDCEGTAILAANTIKSALDGDSCEISDNAVLCRTNAELNMFETALLLRGIPYARKGASSFLGSPETAAFLGYIKMVSGGTDFEGQQKALRSILNTPNRFFVAPDAAKAAVDQALREYASMERMPIKNVDPMEALGDDRFRRSLAHALTKIDRPRSRREEFKLSKTVEKLDAFWEEVADLRETAQAEETTTHQLFDAVLSVSGIELEVDPNTGRITGEKPVTFREAVSNNLKDQGGEDDDAGAEDEDSSMQGLGNISFLYELAKPDPNDPADKAADPRTPFGFRAKMERIKERAKELRYDITAWDKQQEAKPPEERQPPPGVYLGTVHSTKGAQWKNTFVQMPAGKFPFQPPAKPGSEPPPPEVIEKEMQQERRLGYVAITRAIDNLTILCPNEVNGKPAGVSPFVAEAGLHLGENIGAEPTSPEEEPPGEPSKEASDDSGSDWDGYEADYERS